MTRSLARPRLVAVFAAVLLLAGCATRPFESEEVRTELPVAAVALFDADGKSAAEPIPAIEAARTDFNVLALSGGGADGAFGAGVLVGWSESGRRPRFDVVTGVSTGALAATLAFLGPEYDAVLTDAYTNTRNRDVFIPKGITGLFSDSALDYTPLKERIDGIVDEALLDKVAEEHRRGRRLYVATTNLDAGQLVVWDMGRIAASNHPARVPVYRKVLRASAAVPGFFKPVYIQPSDQTTARQMHVDGGVKAPILLRSFMVDSRARHRNVWVLVNGKLKLQDADAAVKPEVLDITRKSITELLRGLLYKTIYQAYVTTRQSKAGFHLMAIPDDAPTLGDGLTFDPAAMSRLYEAGRQIGRAGTWANEPPRLETFERIRS
ncbi:patatin-like phospholipase family protein [Prosthecomicrobium sp. N25]|uniref:patatin-like phospholipase family protein n=1 Tax=Prosthecomicrobium sp. N25 TaxID=3129254 RepID=UPI003076C5A5